MCSLPLQKIVVYNASHKISDDPLFNLMLIMCCCQQLLQFCLDLRFRLIINLAVRVSEEKFVAYFQWFIFISSHICFMHSSFLTIATFLGCNIEYALEVRQCMYWYFLSYHECFNANGLDFHHQMLRQGQSLQQITQIMHRDMTCMTCRRLIWSCDYPQSRRLFTRLLRIIHRCQRIKNHYTQSLFMSLTQASKCE